MALKLVVYKKTACSTSYYTALGSICSVSLLQMDTTSSDDKAPSTSSRHIKARYEFNEMKEVEYTSTRLTVHILIHRHFNSTSSNLFIVVSENCYFPDAVTLWQVVKTTAKELDIMNLMRSHYFETTSESFFFFPPLNRH